MTQHQHGRTIPWFLITVFLFLVIGTLLTGFFFYQTQQNRIKSDAQKNLSAIADLKVKQIVQWRRGCIADGQLIRNNKPLIRLVEIFLKSPNNTDYRQEVLSEMKSYQNIGRYESVVLIDTKQTPQLSASMYGDSIGNYSRTLIKEASLTRAIILSDLHFSKPLPFAHLDLIVPLISVNRNDSIIVGTFLMRIDPQNVLFPLIQTWPTQSRTSETLLLERDGDNVVYLNELRHQKNTMLTLRLPISNEQLPASMAVRGIEGIVDGMDYRGVPVLAAIRGIPDSPWYMNAKVDREEIYEPLRSQAWIVGIGMLLLILASGGIIGFWWRNQRVKFYRDQYVAEVERQALVKHFDYIIKYANDCILLINMDGRIIEANDQACKIYGYTREEFTQLRIHDLRSQKTLLSVDNQLKQVEERGGLVFETEYMRKDGTVFSAEVSSRFIKIDEKRFYQSIIRDITERKKIINTLQTSESFLNNVINQSPYPMWISDNQGTLIRINQACLTLLHITEDEVVGKYNILKDNIVEEQGLMPLVRQAYEAGEAKRFELRYDSSQLKHLQLAHFSSVTLDVTVFPIKNLNGEITNAVIQHIDITERKLAEEAFRESEERYRHLIELSPDTIFIQSEGNIVFINNAGLRLFGATSIGELVGRPVLDFMHPEYREIVAQRIKHLKELQSPVPLIEEKYLRLDGSSIDVEVVASPFLYKGKPSAQVVVRDITERKQAEKALLASEAMLSESQRIAALGHYVLDVKTGCWTCSKTLDEIFGINDTYSKNVEGWVHIVHPDHREEMSTYLKEHVLLEKNPFDKEYKIVRVSDHAVRWMHGLGNLEFDAQGKTIKMFGTIQDITTRKQAENALRNSEERFRRLVESVTDYIYSVKLENGRPVSTTHSPACVSVTGYTSEEYAADPNLWYRMIYEEDKQIVTNLSEKLISGFDVLPLEHRIVHKNGSLRWVKNTPVLKRDSKGDLVAYDGLIEEITMQKQADEALRESEETAYALLNAPSDAAYLLDINQRIISVNEAGAKSLGKKFDELIGVCVHDLFPPDIVESRKFFIDQVLRICKPVHFEDIRGGVHLENSFYPITDAQGNVTRIAVFSRDITERIRAEEALRQNESLFKMLVESSPVAIAVFSGPSKKLEYVSHRFTELFGYDHEEITSMEIWWQLAYPVEEYRNQIEIKWCEIVEKGIREESDIEPLESVVTCKDGSTKYIESTSSSIGEETLVFFTDLTQHRLAQEALRQTHTFNDLLIQTMPFGMDIVDEEGNILFMSKVMKDMIGIDATDSCCWKIYKDDKRQCTDCPLRKGISFGKTEMIETTGVFGGKTYQISHVGMMYEGKKGMLEVFQDITEQKKLQQELIQSQKLLSIGTMAGGIAHDFNNILAIILGYSSILHSIKDQPQKFSDGVTAIRQAVDRGAGLVRQILTFARKTDISFSPLNVSELVKELVSMLQQTFPKIITFNTQIMKSLPYIHADHTQMHQALLNLCVNARDAMPNGGEISIVVEKVSNEKMKERFQSANSSWYICLSVSDTGIGMDEATRNQIFDPFFTTKDKGKGTGLGLSVVYGIVQGHNGFVNVESIVGQRTTFQLYFPVPQESIAGQASQADATEKVAGGNETLLFVEDETLLLDMVQVLLESNGYTVFTAKDGEEAVNVYQQHAHEIDIVISDMGLPKLTGIAEFEKMKEINPAVKIIFASGYFEPDMKATLDAAGAKGFLQKPYVIEDMLSKIRKTLDSD